MKHREQLRPLSYDEQRALEDLQKLHREIQRARGDREQAEAEFDTFVRGFREAEPPQASPPSAVVARERRPASAPPVAPEPRREAVVPSPPASVPIESKVPATPPPVLPPPVAEAPAPAAAAPIEQPRPVAASPSRRIHPAVAVAIGVVILAGLFFAMFGGPAAPDAVRDVPVGGAPAPQQAEPSAPQRAEPAAAAPAQPETGLNLEMITRRPVWVRVTVDGRRAIERELPAGERIPLRATETIVIRAGDAGAVAVRRSGGAETRLGEDGIVATRTFTAEPPRNAAPER